jgi:hypothetical protein
MKATIDAALFALAVLILGSMGTALILFVWSSLVG